MTLEQIATSFGHFGLASISESPTLTLRQLTKYTRAVARYLMAFALAACVTYVAALCGVVASQRSKPITSPRFSDYAINVYEGKHVRPKLDNIRYRGEYIPCKYSVVSRLQDVKPNFSGHYVLQECSCGSGCITIFVWDVKTGVVFNNAPFSSLEIGPYLQFRPPMRFRGLSYREDSSLLIAEGCFDQDLHPQRRDCSRRFYRWVDNAFTQVGEEPLAAPPLSTRP